MFDYEMLKLTLPQFFAFLTAIVLFKLNANRENDKETKKLLEKRLSLWYNQLSIMYAIGLVRQAEWLSAQPEIRNKILNQMYNALPYMSTKEQELVMHLSDLTKQFETNQNKLLFKKCNDTFAVLCISAQEEHKKICKILNLPQPPTLFSQTLCSNSPHKQEASSTPTIEYK